MTAAWRDAVDRLREDPAAALDALEAAAPEDPEAALTLALLLLESEADEAAGVYWLAAAAEGAAPGARQLLARALLSGRVDGRPRPREAVRCLLVAARDGEEGAMDDLVQLALSLDEALLVDAALGLASEAPPMRRAFVDAVQRGAPGWFDLHGDDLLLALGAPPKP